MFQHSLPHVRYPSDSGTSGKLANKPLNFDQTAHSARFLLSGIIIELRASGGSQRRWLQGRLRPKKRR